MVRRVEYLEEFLIGASESPSMSHIEERIVAKKKWFEIEKNRAVGRGRPFMKRLEEAGLLTQFARTMAKQLGFVDGILGLSSEGDAFLKADSNDRNRILVGRMLQTYMRFQQLLVALAEERKKELRVPMEKGPTDSFQRYLKTSGPGKFGRYYFETVLDLATQLGLVNWHVEPGNSSSRIWVVYLACAISFLKQNPKEHDLASDQQTVEIGQETWAITFNNPNHEQFRQELWHDYLELTKYVAKKPVFYSKLRSKVCYSLRMSDSMFDRNALRIMAGGDGGFRLVGAGGTLPFSRDSASLLKSLPPKTDRGEYIVYLKMDRKTNS